MASKRPWSAAARPSRPSPAAWTSAGNNGLSSKRHYGSWNSRSGAPQQKRAEASARPRRHVPAARRRTARLIPKSTTTGRRTRPPAGSTPGRWSGTATDRRTSRPPRYCTLRPSCRAWSTRTRPSPGTHPRLPAQGRRRAGSRRRRGSARRGPDRPAAKRLECWLTSGRPPPCRCLTQGGGIIALGTDPFRHRGGEAVRAGGGSKPAGV